MDHISKYFNAEKTESVFFVIAGIIAILIACYFLFALKKPFQSGIAYSITAIAFIQIVVGTTVYLRSPKDIERVNQLVQTQDEKIQTEEIPRMNVVIKNFTLYKYIEIALVIAGLFLFFFLSSESIKGIGLGLVIQASVMLLLDLIAAARADVYLNFLKGL